MFFNPPSPAQWVSARQGSSSLFLEELRALTSIYNFSILFLYTTGVFRHQVGLIGLVGHPDNRDLVVDEVADVDEE